MGVSGGGAAARRRRLVQLFGVALGAVVLDHATKFLVERSIELGNSITLIGGHLWISHVLNPGVAFGFLSGQPMTIRAPFFVASALIALWVLRRLYLDAGDLLSARIALGLIVGGAVGNAIDRIRYGMVVDFIDVGWGIWRFPTFNAADSCITVGTCLLLIVLWRNKRM